MPPRRRCVVASGVLTVTLSLAACGGGSSKAAAHGGSVADTAGGTGDTGGSVGSKESPRAGTTDVCALLSPADANTVARAQGLSGTQTASTTYKLTATKQPSTGIFPSSACTFTIAESTSDGTGAEATIGMLVQSAIHLDTTGDKDSQSG